MPGRIIPIVTGEIYHIFNRGIDHRPVFTDKWEYERALTVIKFYRFANPPVRLSFFLKWDAQKRETIISEMGNKFKELIEIISYCLMPNHFHLLLKQKSDKGIPIFLSNIQNSYTRYFNIKHKRIGPLLLDQYKAVRIETDEQFLHVSRYIHLNPYTSFIVKNFPDLRKYVYSSLPEYLKSENHSGICHKDQIMSHFKTAKELERFIFDQADYQRELGKIKHLIIE